MTTKPITYIFYIGLFTANFLFSQTSIDLQDTFDISDTVEEPSGLAFDKENNQLFTVSDSDNLYRLSVTGEILETYDLSGDLEGVSMYNTPNTLLIAKEDSYELLEYNYVLDESTPHVMNYTNTNDNNINDEDDDEDIDFGIEGVTYNPTTQEVYFLNEQSPGALIVANSNFNVTNEYPLNFANDYSAAYYVEETGFLWIASEGSSNITKCTTQGDVIETIALTNAQGNALDKLEGIAIDYDNQLLYAVTDLGQELLVYEINDPTLSLDKKTKNNTAISIYPNPAKANFNIKLNSLEQVKQIVLYNNDGKLIKKGAVETLSINTSNLQSGTYILKTITNSNSYTNRIVIE